MSEQCPFPTFPTFLRSSPSLLHLFSLNLNFDFESLGILMRNIGSIRSRSGDGARCGSGSGGEVVTVQIWPQIERIWAAERQR
uniref:Uncharacterized protein n=1 Tax=Kalanchoe fedtschenkoi TaxID=63787 RepID=A0A7N0UEU8_KALFE